MSGYAPVFYCFTGVNCVKLHYAGYGYINLSIIHLLCIVSNFLKLCF